VAEIFDRAVSDLGGSEDALFHGPSHVVWEDENFGNESIEFCLAECDDGQEYIVRRGFEPWHIEVVRRSLTELLAVPEEVRCCEPEDYDEKNPQNYPPTCEVVRVT